MEMLKRKSALYASVVIIVACIATFLYFIIRDGVDMPEQTDDSLEFFVNYVRFREANGFYQKLLAFLEPTDKHSSADAHLVQVILMWLTGHCNLATLLIIAQVAFLSTLYFYWQAIPQSNTQKAAFFTFFVLLYTSLTNVETYIWSSAAVNGGFMLFFCAFSLSFLCRKDINVKHLLFAIGCFVIAYLSFSTAILLIPIGTLILAYNRKFIWCVFWVLATTAVFLWYAYTFHLFGNVSPTTVQLDVLFALKYFVNILASWSLAAKVSEYSFAIGLAELLLFVLLLVTQYHKKALYLMSLSLFMLAACALIAYGRSAQLGSASIYRGSYAYYSIPLLAFICIGAIDHFLLARLKKIHGWNVIKYMGFTLLVYLGTVFNLRALDTAYPYLVPNYYKRLYIETLLDFENNGTIFYQDNSQIVHSGSNQKLFGAMKNAEKYNVRQSAASEYESHLVSTPDTNLTLVNEMGVFVSSTDCLLDDEAPYARLSGKFSFKSKDDYKFAKPYIVLKSKDNTFWYDLYTLSHRSNKSNLFEFFNSTFEVGTFEGLIPKSQLKPGVYQVGLFVANHRSKFLTWTDVFLPYRTYAKRNSSISASAEIDPNKLPMEFLGISLLSARLNRDSVNIFIEVERAFDKNGFEKFSVCLGNDQSNKCFGAIALMEPRMLYSDKIETSNRKTILFCKIPVAQLPGYPLGCESKYTLAVTRQDQGRQPVVSYAKVISLSQQAGRLDLNMPSSENAIWFEGVSNNETDLVELSGWAFTTKLKRQQQCEYVVFMKSKERTVGYYSNRLGRLDVLGVSGHPQAANSGFSVRIPLSALEPGEYKLGVAFFSADTLVSWAYAMNNQTLKIGKKTTKVFKPKISPLPVINIPHPQSCKPI